MIKKTGLLIGFILFTILNLYSQNTSTAPDVYYSSPVKYEIAQIKVEGVKYLDEDVLLQLSGLSEGQSIVVPGDAITKAVKKLYAEGLFSDVKIMADKIVDGKIYLRIFLQERPRLSKVVYVGSKKSETKKLKERLKLQAGVQVTDNLIMNTKYLVEKFYKEKGFYQIKVDIAQRDDKDKPNNIILDIIVKRKNKIKISNVFITGNKEVKASKLKGAMKKTKEKSLINFFKSAKFIKENYEEDKYLLLEKYNDLGYRDASILADSVVPISDKRVNVYVSVKEGPKYYFNNLTWVGNSVYTSDDLSRMLRIIKGDTYNSSLLDKRLKSDAQSVHNLYLDNGYLFCDIMPVETVVGKDSIDVEFRVMERQQATINKVIIEGNNTTHEHVARRELFTYPGDLFSKSLIIRSVRELAQLGHFDPEQIVPTPKPNMENGTVDIVYSLTEKANDQIELSGGWGGGMIIGSVGLKLSNFSMRNALNPKAWRPIPRGDGQTLSLKAQTNGKYYTSFSASFMEPWLGGKKRNSLSTSVYYTHQTGFAPGYNPNSYARRGGGQAAKDDEKYMDVLGASVGLGRRLKWPDNWFSMYNELSYQRYNLKNWDYYIIHNGHVNNFSFSTTISRNSTDSPLYPRKGSNLSLKVSFTPPYSLISGKDYSNVASEDKYDWIEYHKWEFKSKFYTPLTKPQGHTLVLYTGIEYGFLGYYNKDRKSPFEGYEVGGDGMSGYSNYGKTYVKMRGYKQSALSARATDANGDPLNGSDANIYSKMTMELRYPLSLAQSATIYALAFVEAGNSWSSIQKFQPFDLKRSAGVGVRIFLPMFGLLGIDWGYGYDMPNSGKASDGKSQFSFVLGKEF
ncbi:MAG: outer membrane protein assembly factor BamA [Marinifilaceae bacterium]